MMRHLVILKILFLLCVLLTAPAEAQSRRNIYGFSGGSSHGVYGVRQPNSSRSFGLSNSAYGQQFGVSRSQNFFSGLPRRPGNSTLGSRANMNAFTGIGRGSNSWSGVSSRNNSFGNGGARYFH